jgi:hypothetical protein
MRFLSAGTFVLVLVMFTGGCDFQLLRDRPDDRRQDIWEREDNRPPLYDDADLRHLWSQIDRVMQTGARSSMHCTTMPIGAKPCGGPWTHLVYSSSTTNETRLRSLVARFNERQAHLNRKLGLLPTGEHPVATCDFEMPPPTALIDGHCQVAPPGRR